MRQSGQWLTSKAGAGEVLLRDGEVRLSIPMAASDRYHDAQISDYRATGPRFGNRPPLRLSLRARGEGKLQGTAGFGFWNQVFVPGRRRFRLPQAIWFFFASPPNDIALAKDVPGNGWKAATINARGWRFYGLLPLAPLGFLAMRSGPFTGTSGLLGKGRSASGRSCSIRRYCATFTAMQLIGIRTARYSRLTTRLCFAASLCRRQRSVSSPGWTISTRS